MYKKAIEKSCTKCKKVYPATTGNFSRDSRASDNFQSQCRTCCNKASNDHYKRNRTERRKQRAEYKATKRGYLKAIYHNITWRCSGKCKLKRFRCYNEQQTVNRFNSSDDFVNYVLNVLKVDPRGKDCHRIDPDGHYEPGNIEFLAPLEHRRVHARMRKVAIS
jgi:hypothetical protein